MRKILPILVVLAMVCASVPMVLAADPFPDQLIDDANPAADVATHVTIGGGSTGGSAPIVKCKWEYDLTLVEGYPVHDADLVTDGLQVKPVIGGQVKVGFFAVVTDPDGVNTISSIYADVWHPNGDFKYQQVLAPLGKSGSTYENTPAMAAWTHVTTYHNDLITFNPSYTNESEITEEIAQNMAYVYYCEAYISYCQPGGWYLVGIRGCDTYNTWCNYLYNSFWYIPTSAIEIDFTEVNYGTFNIPSADFKWVPGDTLLNTPNFPTVRNTGNTPVNLYVWQNDMNFGKTGEVWNVQFDARLGHPGVNGDVVYWPKTNATDHIGVPIPGTLLLCTQDKLDFSIHPTKGLPAATFTGIMKLTAYINMSRYIWDTPSQWHQVAPGGVLDPTSHDGS